MSAPAPLSVEELAHRCDARQFAFATTDELEDIGVIPGQERATDAIELAVGIERDGYNLFVMGPAGCGRHTLVRQRMEVRAKGARRPSDWVYVNNFPHLHRPIAIELPPGRGVALRTDMARLVEELRSNIPAVFEGDEYRSKVDSIDAEFKERHEKAFSALAAASIGLERIVIVKTTKDSDSLWAAEQALRSAACGGVLAWPRDIRYTQLRHLQLAAEGGRCLAVLFRPTEAAREPTPAVLRIALATSVCRRARAIDSETPGGAALPADFAAVCAAGSGRQQPSSPIRCPCCG